ncbi:BAAT/acyl-CoA thioester hydrolase C-terminal domain protein [Pseudoramibacter alactolyticus ATCC 23263]|mgnify:CR=1 FL=1|uniref:BAAT/acyl-CoA thioester hydrolase C-terminal domain protein n=1 Tax=Pseudoramibacter alactolyticus ATCC 23263 TaxID=887929 RepID=E6MFZ7_9FIRM|nr:acyl-CoA thioester hydrolase/BAAT C-terminal domain-containing protein [Pseudoramibacter alactolyticus]EFV01537.1 BAAT/acyl-CoA thioester hydrolase C-terminal domain protein [Pseudoramibacter alactolyticus ATCC 23263]
MKHNICLEHSEGFYGCYLPALKTNAAIILTVDDSADDFLAKAGIKWIQSMGISALSVSPNKQTKGLHSWPLEHVEKAVGYLKKKGYGKLGIAGISAGSNIALNAASRIPDITLTIALTPVDYVLWGYLQDGLDGSRERPAEGESAFTWRGEPVPCMPAPYRHPEYWEAAVKEKKRRGDLTAARNLFDEAENRHPVTELEVIPVENIKGYLFLAGSEDDVLWDTCRSIRRMQSRIEKANSECRVEAHTYEHCTHFIFPETMLAKMIPGFLGRLVLPVVFKEAKGYARECKHTRMDVDQRIKVLIERWDSES